MNMPIGFPPNHRNDNGGIAIGYGYDAAGNINRAVCGGTLWSTGEQLRNARDPAIIQRLQPGGPLIVDGLQGNAVPLLRPQNEPPLAAYFIDYDDRFDDPQTRGHLGDVVIWRVCPQGALPLLIPAAIICPAGQFNVDGVCWAGLACPPGTEFANGCCVYRGCPPSYARIRGQCVPPPLNCRAPEIYANTLTPGHCEAPKCPLGLVVVQRKTALGGAVTLPPSGGGNGGILPRPPEGNCPVGQVMINDVCQPSGGGCPPGQTRINDVCQPTGGMCVNYCGCPEGTRLREDGTCRPKVVARKERCRLETACAGRLKAVVRKERYRLAMVCADLQAVARKAPARAVTANASARVRPCSLTASAAPARSFRPTVAAARKARRRIGTVHANPPLRGRFVSAPIAHGRRPRQSLFRRAAVRPLVPAACHAIPTEIARRPRSAAAARYSTATPAAVKPA